MEGKVESHLEKEKLSELTNINDTSIIWLLIQIYVMPSPVFKKEQFNLLTISLSNRGKNAPSVFDDLVEAGDWKFIPNYERTESAVRHDSRPTPPCRLLKEGYKYSSQKIKMVEYQGHKDVEGIALICVQDRNTKL